VCLIVSISPTDDGPHEGALAEEWVFAAWIPDGSLGLVSGHRLLGPPGRRRAWYWFALVEHGRPLLHITEWEVGVRSDPFIVKAPEMWAEHHCVAPMEQWSIGNEAYAVALDSADEALGRGYGVPTPLATDIEWYASTSANSIEHGFEQAGVAHGVIELGDRPNIEVAEIAARRWHRWTAHGDLAPVALEPAVAHTGLRAAFAFPDGSVIDWVLNSRGWCVRALR